MGSAVGECAIGQRLRSCVAFPPAPPLPPPRCAAELRWTKPKMKMSTRWAVVLCSTKGMRTTSVALDFSPGSETEDSDSTTRRRLLEFARRAERSDLRRTSSSRARCGRSKDLSRMAFIRSSSAASSIRLNTSHASSVRCPANESSVAIRDRSFAVRRAGGTHCITRRKRRLCAGLHRLPV